MLCKNRKSTTFNSSATSRAMGASITHVYSSTERHRPVLEVELAPDYVHGEMEASKDLKYIAIRDSWVSSSSCSVLQKASCVGLVRRL